MEAFSTAVRELSLLILLCTRLLGGTGRACCVPAVMFMCWDSPTERCRMGIENPRLTLWHWVSCCQAPPAAPSHSEVFPAGTALLAGAEAKLGPRVAVGRCPF